MYLENFFVKVNGFFGKLMFVFLLFFLEDKILEIFKFSNKLKGLIDEMSVFGVERGFFKDCDFEF